MAIPSDTVLPCTVSIPHRLLHHIKPSGQSRTYYYCKRKRARIQSLLFDNFRSYSAGRIFRSTFPTAVLFSHSFTAPYSPPSFHGNPLLSLFPHSSHTMAYKLSFREEFMKRIFCSILAGSLLVLSLAGCQKESETLIPVTLNEVPFDFLRAPVCGHRTGLF